MERNIVTHHASVHPVHDVIMTGVQSLRSRQQNESVIFFVKTRLDDECRAEQFFDQLIWIPFWDEVIRHFL